MNKQNEERETNDILGGGPLGDVVVQRTLVGLEVRCMTVQGTAGHVGDVMRAGDSWRALRTVDNASAYFDDAGAAMLWVLKGRNDEPVGNVPGPGAGVSGLA